MALSPFQAISKLTVNSTISQDRSLGRTVEEDLNLASFGQRLLSWTESHTDAQSTTTSTAPVELEPPPPRTEGNHSLQDYQMQLMLLEQQNKKKLLWARAEQEEIIPRQENTTSNKEVMEVPAQGLDLKAPRVFTSTPPTVGKAQDNAHAQQDTQTREAEQVADRLNSSPLKVAAQGDGKARKRRRESIGDSQVNFLSKSVDCTIVSDDPSSFRKTQNQPKQQHPKKSRKATNRLPPTAAQSSTCSPIHGLTRQLHSIIYRVSCHSSITSGKMMYLDVPRRGYSTPPSQHFHLRGSSQVHDLGTFLSEAGPLVYLVFRDLSCDDTMRWDFGQSSTSFCDSQLFWRESIAILDENLRSCVDDVARCAPNASAYHSEPSSLSYSYQFHSSKNKDSELDLYEPRFFYHHRKVLDSLLPSLNSPLREQVQDLLDFIESCHGTVYSEADKLLSQGLVHRDHLEMLFCPNDIVISKQSGSLTASVLRSWPDGNSVLTLHCWAWGFDGQWLHRKPNVRTVSRPLKNVVQIRNLEVYPLRYATDEEKSALYLRSQKFWDLKYKNLSSYEGWDFRAEQYYSNEARCMIDYKTYRRFHPDAEAFQFSKKALAPFDRWPESIPHNATLDERIMILLPPVIHGFFLKDKKWVTLLVDNIGPVTWNKDAFERLVLPKRTKDLVKALVMVRTSKLGEKHGMSLTGKRKRDDLIAGKGSGLIMLLHGGPGTGKTLTAESVAEIAEMPLYNVTCGDIGTSADAVEKYLQTVLILGKTWNCVLLLDEADVFLEERSLSDLQRNSLVSVFLRTLEYYDGILILTSNRVGTFDEAFKSRIQVALHYQNLDRVSRKKIWKNFFDMMEADEEDVNLDDLNRHLHELSDQDMNGRQIRNALTTARQLALFQKETLGWEHVEQAIMTARDFNKYLGSVHGHTDDQYARDQELR